ncbi:DUF397 domain-containing protein [Streptomyces albus subsp. chlorinus]|uniref:DUF397 domain-containing protein n=1 Tax=Streptomyces albus TaxID=1888 RepID=UPI00157033F5|nr:DUF397 domain-containing protein [Streptomyces albus subsp. chlorinus]
MNSKSIVSPFSKSSYSGGGTANECVEVAHTSDGGRAVRDSKEPGRGVAHFAPGAWRAFLTHLNRTQAL